MSVQRTMPFGTPDQVRAEVKERIETVAGRAAYIIAAGTHVGTGGAVAERLGVRPGCAGLWPLSRLTYLPP